MYLEASTVLSSLIILNWLIIGFDSLDQVMLGGF